MTGERVAVFDTTLRDGEQSPGASMTSAEKLEIARALARLGVDVIEAGFPAASNDDHAAVSAIASQVGGARTGSREPPMICGLARAATPDIDQLLESSSAARFTAAVLDANSRGATEIASLRVAQAGAEIYATDLREALTVTEAAAARHADSLSAIIAARDVEIAALKKVLADRS